MDVTGQAFEDMQEQNIRLMQQLREKDDANFKLMSERIKSNQIYKLLREEKEELADQVLTFKTQVRETVEDELSPSCVFILSYKAVDVKQVHNSFGKGDCFIY